MKRMIAWLVLSVAALGLAACGGGGNRSANDLPALVVNSLADEANPAPGTVTLRSALASAANGQPIVFDTTLDGGTIELSTVGDAHTILMGEVMGMRDEPSGPVSYLVGYFARDYGASALYARKNVVIDASDLPSGIVLRWAGGPAGNARVLAVFGNLTMNNVTVTGGFSEAVDISTGDPADQPWTLARGGGVAVWGIARLTDCTIYGNTCSGDFDSSRDRGAFGGGLYADIVDVEGCVISGNTVIGAGAAGGGVFSVGGAMAPDWVSTINRSSITGNRISGLFAYGGGVYSDGGGIGNRKTMDLRRSTIARNLVDPPPGMPPFLLAMGYWRGGGAYMSNGYLNLESCTVAENQVHGVARTDALGKPNLAGGIAATIGNAHAVEEITMGNCLVVGNTVHEMGGATYEHDIFTGSLLYFSSQGYNRIGVIDFSQILVPVGEPGWASLCRRHYPKVGDADGVGIADVLDPLNGVTLSDRIDSAWGDVPERAVLYYTPLGSAVDQVPEAGYSMEIVTAEYNVDQGPDIFLEILLDRLEAHYGLAGFAAGFTSDFELFLGDIHGDGSNERYQNPQGVDIVSLAGTQWFGPAVTWPKELPNYPYIEFWHRLDSALQAAGIAGMGPEGLGDEQWQTLFPAGELSKDGTVIMMRSDAVNLNIDLLPDVDQTGRARPANAMGDIGAIEVF